MDIDCEDYLSKRTKYQGYLKKWTNYIKSYQKRWFVYEKGYLSYFRNPSEVGKDCRGQIHLSGLKLRPTGQLSFTVFGKSDLTYVLKADTKREYDVWIDVLENAIKEFTLNSIHDRLSDSSFKTLNSNEEFDSKLENFRNNATVAKESCFQLTIFAAEIYATFKNVSQDINNTNNNFKLRDIYKQLDDNLQTFNDLNNKVKCVIEDLARSTDLLAEAASINRLQSKSLGLKTSQNIMSQQNTSVSILDENTSSQFNSIDDTSSPSNTKEHLDITGMMTSTKKKSISSEDEFFDAVEQQPETTPIVKLNDNDYLATTNKSSTESLARLTKRINSNSYDPINVIRLSHVRSSSDITRCLTIGQKKYRSSIPPRPDSKMSLWGIVKNLMGKDLSKVPLPVNFNEPLSMLQRVTETLEYANLLNKAANCDDPPLQMCYLLAFCVSTYASTVYRTGKPFNPLLGETYEFDRTEDLGWRAISEQVSHHPPVSVLHTEGQGWILWETFNVKSKFRAKYLQIDPIGLSQIIFNRTGFHYSWNKVITTVNNIILGALWIDQSGILEMTNHSTGDTCSLEFAPYSYIKKAQPRKISGVVKDKHGNSRYILHGYWDKIFECTKLSPDTVSTSDGVASHSAVSHQVLWTANVLPQSASAMYYFSEFTCSLNETSPNVAPTDSRFRPDQRIMEEGDFVKANNIKQILEQSQRERRKVDLDQAKTSGRAASDASHEDIYEPLWFRIDKESNLNTGAPLYKYKGGYWEAKQRGDWSMCPRLFDVD